MDKQNDFNKKLAGRLPERSWKSGGIGGTFIDKVAAEYIRDVDFSELHLGSVGDVPHTLITDAREYPLGRYLMSRFRKKSGLSIDGKTPEGKIDEIKKALRELREEEFKEANFKPSKKNMEDAITKKNENLRINIESRYRTFKQRGNF